MFSSTEKKALLLYNQNGSLKKLAAFFLITNNGNMLNFSIYKQASLGFFDLLSGVSSTEKIFLIQSKLSSIQEVEEFSIFNALADMLYKEGITRTLV